MDFMGFGSSAQFSGVIAAGDELVGECILVEIPFVISLLDEFNGLSVGAIVPLIDPDDQPLAGEGLSEVVQFEVLVSGIGVSNIVVALGFAVGGVDLPGAVVAELVHETVLHAGEDHVVDPVSVFRDVVLFVDMGVDAASDSHHP